MYMILMRIGSGNGGVDPFPAKGSYLAKGNFRGKYNIPSWLASYRAVLLADQSSQTAGWPASGGK